MKIKIENLTSIFFEVMVFAIIVGIFVLVISALPNQLEFDRQAQLTYDKCCNGSPCTDTYYDDSDGKCHSTFYPLLPTKWYITIPVVFGVALLLTFIVSYTTRNGGIPK